MVCRYNIRSGSLWCKKDGKCHLDKLFVLVNRLQRAAYVSTNFGRSSLLDLKRKLHDGSLKGELVFVDPEQQ
jgi:hypothetical protein